MPIMVSGLMFMKVNTMTNTQANRTPAQIFALAISEGYYKAGDLMCMRLSYMWIEYDIITKEEYDSAKDEIKQFLDGFSTMAGRLALYFRCNVTYVYDLALAIYSDWDNRYAILASPFEHDNRNKV